MSSDNKNQTTSGKESSSMPDEKYRFQGKSLCVKEDCEKVGEGTRQGDETSSSPPSLGLTLPSSSRRKLTKIVLKDWKSPLDTTRSQGEFQKSEGIFAGQFGKQSTSQSATKTLEERPEAGDSKFGSWRKRQVPKGKLSHPRAIEPSVRTPVNNCSAGIKDSTRIVLSMRKQSDTSSNCGTETPTYEAQSLTEKDDSAEPSEVHPQPTSSDESKPFTQRLQVEISTSESKLKETKASQRKNQPSAKMALETQPSHIPSDALLSGNTPVPLRPEDYMYNLLHYQSQVNLFTFLSSQNRSAISASSASRLPLPILVPPLASSGFLPAVPRFINHPFTFVPFLIPRYAVEQFFIPIPFQAPSHITEEFSNRHVTHAASTRRQFTTTTPFLYPPLPFLFPPTLPIAAYVNPPTASTATPPTSPTTSTATPPTSPTTSTATPPTSPTTSAATLPTPPTISTATLPTPPTISTATLPTPPTISTATPPPSPTTSADSVQKPPSVPT